MARSDGSQGLHDEHWQEMTHKVNATLREAVVSGVNKLLGGVVQAAILLTVCTVHSYLYRSRFPMAGASRCPLRTRSSESQRPVSASNQGHIDTLWRASPGTQGDPGQDSVPEPLRTGTESVATHIQERTRTPSMSVCP